MCADRGHATGLLVASNDANTEQGALLGHAADMHDGVGEAQLFTQLLYAQFSRALLVKNTREGVLYTYIYIERESVRESAHESEGERERNREESDSCQECLGMSL